MQPTRWSFTPAVEEILAPPPAPAPEPPSIRRDVQAESAWLVLTLANVLVAAIIIIGMVLDGSTAKRAILFGAIYFFPTMAIFVLALTGTLTDVIRGGQMQRTERQRIAAYADLAELAIQWRLTIEENRRLELESQALPADLQRRLAAIESDLLERSLPAPTAPGATYVTPYDNRPRGAFASETQPAHDTTATEALAWAMSLYTDTGLPDPRRVQLLGKPDAIGKVKGEVLGSKRGEGSREALLWLLHRRVLKKVPGGYALNLSAFPRREELRYIR